MWKATLKAQCVLWFLEDGKPTSVQKKFRKKYGRNARSPDVKSIKIWAEKFKTTGSCHQRKKSPQKPKFDRTAILKHAEENPRQSLRRRANHLKMSHSTVRRVLKSSSYRPYHPQVVQALNRDDYSKRLSFANWGLEKIGRFSTVHRVPFILRWSHFSFRRRRQQKKCYPLGDWKP